MNANKLTIGVLGMFLALGAMPLAAADGGPEDPSVTIPDPVAFLTATGIQGVVSAACDPTGPSGACNDIINAAVAFAETVCTPPDEGACAVIIAELTEDCAAGPGPECDVTIALGQAGIIIGGAAGVGGTAAAEAGGVLAQAIIAAGTTQTAAGLLVADKLTEAGTIVHAAESHVTGYVSSGVGTVTGAVKANICDYDGAGEPTVGSGPDPQVTACGLDSSNNPLTALADFLTSSVNTFKNGITTVNACNNAVATVTSVHGTVGGNVGTTAQCGTNAPQGSDVPDL